MKQTDSTLYDKEYYQNAYGTSVVAADGPYFSSQHHTIFSEMANMLHVEHGSTIVDYGCGNGDLTFFLVARYGCRAIGIDYSKSAVDICREKLTMLPLQKDKITFINANNDQTHAFQNIAAVYMADVVEHMYDPEIALVLEQFKTWGEKIKVVIHTDNNIYLNTIRPIFDLIDIVCGFRTWKQVRDANRLDRSLHINLTNPFRFRKFMKAHGFKEVLFKYPTLHREERIRRQLGPLGKISFLVGLSTFVLDTLNFLSPTFYALYEKI